LIDVTCCLTFYGFLSFFSLISQRGQEKISVKEWKLNICDSILAENIILEFDSSPNFIVNNVFSSGYGLD